jgi:hypothetical protein
MKKNITVISLLCKVLVSVFMMILSTTANAQTDLPDAPDDAPAAPIDDCIPALFVIGIVLGGYVFLKKRKQLHS